MASIHHHHSARKAAKVAGRAASQSAKCAEKAAVGLARWGTDDHTGTVKFPTDMLPTGFLNVVTIPLVQLLYTLLGVAGSVAMFLLLFMFVLPWLFGM